MAATYWIKLYQDILKDPKMGRLSDSAYRRCIELFLLAGEQKERNGTLPSVDDIAWELRVSKEKLQSDLSELEKVGIISFIEGIPFVVNFSKRQTAVTGAERVSQYRQREKRIRNESETEVKQYSNETVTESYTDIETDIDNILPVTDVPVIDEKPKRAITNSSEQQSMVGVLCEVMHKDTKMNGKRFARFASDLLKSGYTPDEISSWYSSGGWYYQSDWRGKKGQVPNEAVIRDTVKMAKGTLNGSNHTAVQTSDGGVYV